MRKCIANPKLMYSIICSLEHLAEGMKNENGIVGSDFIYFTKRKRAHANHINNVTIARRCSGIVCAFSFRTNSDHIRCTSGQMDKFDKHNTFQCDTFQDGHVFKFDYTSLANGFASVETDRNLCFGLVEYVTFLVNMRHEMMQVAQVVSEMYCISGRPHEVHINRAVLMSMFICTMQ